MTFSDLLIIFYNSFKQSNLWVIDKKSNSVSQSLTPLYMLFGYEAVTCEYNRYYAKRTIFFSSNYTVTIIEIDSLEILIRKYLGEYHEL